MKNALILDNKKKIEGKHTYILPIDNMDKILAMIDGHNGNALKLAIVLFGTKDGFKPTIKYIHDRTGMSKTSYYRARDYLEEIGFITVTDSKIKINI